MAQPDLIKSRVVMALVFPVLPEDETAQFSSWREEGDTNHLLMVQRETWDDMGKPSLITVTIEPGDKLNAP